MTLFTIKQNIKRALLGRKRPLKMRFGLPKSIVMVLDPQHSTQFLLGLAEAEIFPMFKKFSQRSEVFFDIGAASGYLSLIYKKLNKKGKMFLFEPETSFQKIQDMHFDLNHFERNYEQKAIFVSNKVGPDSITIDAFMEAEKLQDAKLFFKVDVDGDELRVLEGADNTLRNCNCTMIFETHSLKLEEDCIKYLQSRGYTTNIIKNAWWRTVIKEIRPIEHNRWFYAYKDKAILN